MKNLFVLLLVASPWSSLGMAYSSACIVKPVISAICHSSSGIVARADVSELIQNPEFKDSSNPERICTSNQYNAFFIIWMPKEDGSYERIVNLEVFGPKEPTINSDDGGSLVQFDQNTIRAYYMSPEETSYGDASAISVHRRADSSIVGSLRLGKSIKSSKKYYALENCTFVTK